MARPAVIDTAPAASNVRVAEVTRLSAMSRGTSSAAPRPTGTLTHRTHCQPSPSVSTPPRSTPTAPPEPATAPHTPRALLRSAPSVNVIWRIDSAAGDMSAPPRPWTARAALIMPCDSEKPPTREASAKSTSPAMKISRRPRKSAMRPPSRRNPPNTSTYALTTQERSSCSMRSASPMEGRATCA